MNLGRKVRSIGPAPAKIMIVGEALGKAEEESGEPFCNKAGAGGQLDLMLYEAGIVKRFPVPGYPGYYTYDRSELFITNVVKYRPPSNELFHFFIPTAEAKAKKLTSYRGLYPTHPVIEGLRELYEDIERVKPNIIIAFGNYALWALTDVCKCNDGSDRAKGWLVPTGIGKWRGSVISGAHRTLIRPDLPDLIPPPGEEKKTLPEAAQLVSGVSCKVLPAYHPAFVLRVWEERAITVHDLRRAKTESEYSETRIPDYNFYVRPAFSTVIETLDELINAADHFQSLNQHLVLAADTETRNRQIACLGIAWTRYDAICIPFLCVEKPIGYWTYEEECAIILKFMALAKHPAVRWLGQNFTYDMQYFARCWKFIFPLHSDTMYTQHVIFPGTPKGLDYLASMHCDYYCYWKDEGKEWDISIDEEQYWAYNCKDAVNTYEIYFSQLKVIDSMKLHDQWKYMMDLFPVALETMLRGVAINGGKRKELYNELMSAIQEREAWFTSVIPYRFAKSKTAKPWYRSPKQQQTFFYEILQLPIQKHKKSKKPTVDDEALEKLMELEPLIKPIAVRLQEYRSLGVFLNTFVLANLSDDGRMRCEYKISGTETFRLASSEDVFGYGTNLQNIPKGSEDD